MTHSPEYMRAWRKRNPTLCKAYRLKCADRRRQINKIWASKNRDKINRYRRKRYWTETLFRQRSVASAKRHAPLRNLRHKERWRLDANYRLRILLRNRMRLAVNQNSRFSSVLDLLGCSVDNFRIYIHSKFEPGMTWENIHLDHILPCALFDLTRLDHQRICFHFSNYQPLFASDNIRKGAKVTFAVNGAHPNRTTTEDESRFRSVNK